LNKFIIREKIVGKHAWSAFIIYGLYKPYNHLTQFVVKILYFVNSILAEEKYFMLWSTLHIYLSIVNVMKSWFHVTFIQYRAMWISV